MKLFFALNTKLFRPCAQIALCLLLLHHFFFLFMIGGIFHGSFLPLIKAGHFVFFLLYGMYLLPFALRKPSPQGGFWNLSASRLQWLSVSVFAILIFLRSWPRDEHLWVNGYLTAATAVLFLLMAPRIFEKRHYLVLFWFVCILATIHAVCQIGFILGQTQTFCGFNVNMPHGRLMHVPSLPLLTKLDGYTGGWFTNPNCLASYIMAVPALSLFLSQPAVTPKKYLRWLCFAFFWLSLLSLFLTFSRAAILSTMIGLIPIVVLELKKRKIPIVVSLLLAVVIMGTLFLWQMHWTTLGNPFSLSGRQDLWKVTLDGLKHLPLFGYGPYNGVGVVETPHNVFLANLLFYGFPGFLAFLVLIGSSLWLGGLTLKKDLNFGMIALYGFLLAYVFAYSQIEYVLTCPYSFSNSVALLLIGFFVHLHLQNPLQEKLPLAQAPEVVQVRYSRTSQVPKFAITFLVFVPLVLIAASLYPILSPKGNDYPVGTPERFTARIGRFLQSNQNPDLMVIGSSQMISFGLCCDWFYEGVKPPFEDFPSFLKYQSDYGRFKHLETLLKKRGLPDLQSVSLALPGGTGSDYRYLMDKMLAYGKQPKYLVIGISPRDLGEPQCLLISANQQVLGQFNNVREKSVSQIWREVRRSFKSLLGANGYAAVECCGLKVPVPRLFQEYRREIRADLFHNFYEQMSELQVEIASAVGKKNMKEEIKSQILLRRNILNDVAHYKANYAIYKEETFQKRFEDLRYCLRKAKDKNIVAFVVDMPLPKENINLLPETLSRIYREGLNKVCREEGVRLIQPKARAAFPLSCFYDCTHLNIEGGHRLSEAIADAIGESQAACNVNFSNTR